MLSVARFLCASRASCLFVIRNNSQPKIIMKTTKIFSASVKADTLPKPTLVMQDRVKYRADRYRADGVKYRAVKYRAVTMKYRAVA